MENHKIFGIIYRAYLDDGRSYIGQTTKYLQKRMKEHKNSSKKPKTHFHRAIRQYDFESFKWEILEETSLNSKENLVMLENKWINFYNSIKNGFNEVVASVSTTHSKKTKQSLSEDRKGSGNPNYGKNSAMRGKGGTYSELIPTKFKEGHIPWNKGIKSDHKIKLSFEVAEEIREMYKNDVLIREICEKYNIQHNTVHDIVAGRIWRNSSWNNTKTKEMAISEYKNGLSIEEISKKINKSKITIWRYLKNETCYKYSDNFIEILPVEEIRDRFRNQKYTITELSKIYNTTIYIIRCIIYHKGIYRLCK